MRAAAADADVERVAGADERVADAAQLLEQLVVPRVHVGVDLDHALGDLGHHGAGKATPVQQVEQVRARVDQVEVAQADELQLELDAEGQRLRGLEGFEGHVDDLTGSSLKR
jgi:hypothetical protein